MIQHWDEENPCPGCGAVSNTGHSSGCYNFGKYDEEGNEVVAVPAVPETPVVEELTFTEETLQKVYDSIINATNCDEDEVLGAISNMQNAGILFRERVVPDGQG